jgi:hypothetical protein
MVYVHLESSGSTEYFATSRQGHVFPTVVEEDRGLRSQGAFRDLPRRTAQKQRSGLSEAPCPAQVLCHDGPRPSGLHRRRQSVVSSRSRRADTRPTDFRGKEESCRAVGPSCWLIHCLGLDVTRSSLEVGAAVWHLPISSAETRVWPRHGPRKGRLSDSLPTEARCAQPRTRTMDKVPPSGRTCMSPSASRDRPSNCIVRRPAFCFMRRRVVSSPDVADGAMAFHLFVLKIGCG